MQPEHSLAIELCGLRFRNPVFAASGTFGYGLEFAPLVDLEQLGAVITKGLSREPIEGNPAPRLWEADAGMINSVGLQNVGVRRFVAEKLPALSRYRVPVIANVFGYSVDDYREVVLALEDAPGVAAYELNVSCPNTKHGGMYFSSDPALLAELVAQLRPLVRRRPLIVKLSPNVASIATVAKAAEDAGADAVSLVNTFVALAIDARTRRARIGAGLGGLSGPAIKPLALRMVYEAARVLRVPVIGLGGVTTGEDAAEFLIAGARAVQVGTASFVDPGAAPRVARQLAAFLLAQKVAHVSELVGTLHVAGC